MNQKVKEFIGGVSFLSWAVKSRDQRRKELIQNPIVRELITIAYNEGYWYYSNLKNKMTLASGTDLKTVFEKLENGEL